MSFGKFICTRCGDVHQIRNQVWLLRDAVTGRFRRLDGHPCTENDRLLPFGIKCATAQLAADAKSGGAR